ncbi:MAG: ATP-binding cassette domain-containing protein [Patescibacteria group bacterium]|nr:ATP-binding cassette domain-containing protein [Patescibacteria group bacterium]
MSKTENVIVVKGLVKHFGKVKAVSGVSFSVKKGEILGFLGPNGAGKTTTIRCMMDFLRADAGTITILGKDSKKDTVSIKEKVGYLSGNVRLYDKWSGEEHIKFVESIRGKSDAARKYAKKLDLDLKKKFKTLSSGNKQKLGLVLALMNKPEVVIMDEPTVGLDPLLQNTIYDILEELRKKGSTIFISSHNLAEVEKICDRVAIIKDGKMVTVSRIEDLEFKKIHRVEARLSGKFTAKEFEFNGVTEAKKNGSVIILTVEGHINPVIEKLAGYKIENIEITHASLEEVFLNYYKKEK